LFEITLLKEWIKLLSCSNIFKELFISNDFSSSQYSQSYTPFFWGESGCKDKPYFLFRKIFWTFFQKIFTAHRTLHPQSNIRFISFAAAK